MKQESDAESNENILAVLRLWDAKGRLADRRRQVRMKHREEMKEEQNDIGLRRWANSLGHLKAGKQLPF